MILETFYILFKSNADNVKKGTADAKKTVDGLDKQLKSTSDLTSQVSEAFLNMGRAVAGAAAGYFSLKSLLQGLQQTADYSLQLGRTAELLGVNVELLDEWSSAVRRFGGDANTFQQSVMSVANHLGTSFADTVRILPALGEYFKTMSETRALRYGEMLGLDRSLILFLSQGTKEVDALIQKEKELGVVTEQNAEAAIGFNKEWENTKDVLKSSYLTIDTQLLPVFGKFLEVVQYGEKHLGLLEGALVTAGIASLFFLAPYAALIAAIAGSIVVFGSLIKALERVSTESMLLRTEDKDRWYKNTSAKKLHGFFKTPSWGVEKFYEDRKDQWDTVASRLQNKHLEQTMAAIDLVNRSPLTSMTSQSIANHQQNSNQSVDIKIDEINIATQATDAAGISRDIHKSIQEHLWQANSYFDNGVLA